MLNRFHVTFFDLMKAESSGWGAYNCNEENVFYKTSFLNLYYTGNLQNYSFT